MDSYQVADGIKYTRIQFMSEDGRISDQPPGNPVVTVTVHFDLYHNTNPSTPTSLPVYALFDTGATLSYATPDFIGFSGLPLLGQAEVRGGTSTEEGTHHVGHILFQDAKVQIEVDILSAKLRNSMATEHMVIGMNVISMGRLIMDFKSHVYRFYWA
jgi:hypothetical protein